MQVPRQMHRASEALLHLFDVNRRINDDGIITIAEVREQRAAERAVESAFEQADLGVGIVMAALKGGPECRAYADQRREYELIWGELGYTDPRPANVIPLDTKKRHHRANGDDAA